MFESLEFDCSALNQIQISVAFQDQRSYEHLTLPAAFVPCTLGLNLFNDRTFTFAESIRIN